MKRVVMIMMIVLLSSFAVISVQAQCSICTRTAQQLGERPAKALNAGILYLAAMPMAIFGIIGYKWWQKNKH